MLLILQKTGHVKSVALILCRIIALFIKGRSNRPILYVGYIYKMFGQSVFSIVLVRKRKTVDKSKKC